MIYISTIAYREKYRDFSLKLIESVKSYVENAQVIVMTDDVSFYENIQDISVVEGPICHYNPWFKANLKSYALEAAMNFAKEDDIVIYMDADCFFIKEITVSHEAIVPYGLSVKLGETDNEVTLLGIEDVMNASIRDKIRAINPNESQKYYVFREGFLMFKVHDSFRVFIQSWKDIFQELEDKKLHQANQTFDIQNAALRANLPIYDIKNSSPWRGSVTTVAVDGGKNCLV